MARLSIRRTPLLLFAFVQVACGIDFVPSSYLTDLRVVAIIAEPPEIAAGETSQIRAVLPAYLDPTLATLDWAVCSKPVTPSQGQAVSPECIEEDTAPYLIPSGSGLMTMVTMPAQELLNLGFPDQSGGFYTPVRLRATYNGKTLSSVYRLRRSLGLIPPNKNPALENIFIVSDSGAATPLVESDLPEVTVTSRITLRATAKAGSVENYLRPTGDPRNLMFEPVDESLRFSWYATAGTWSEDVTGQAEPDTVLSFDKRAPTQIGPIDLYVVLREERGGIDVVHRRLQFQP